MNIVTTTAWPNLGTAANQASASPAGDANTTSAVAVAPPQVQGHHPHHHEHHGDGDEHSGHHDQQAYMALQIKVEQTFSALTSPGTNASATDPNATAAAGGADKDSDEDGGGFAATLRARFSVSEGGMSASLSIRMGNEGQGAIGDLAAQMQGFVQTLYAALHTLLGGSTANPNATLGTPVSTGAAAALTSASATAVAPAATDAVDTSTAAATTTDTTTPATGAGASTEASAPAAAASSPSGSLSIKLRMTYTSFGSQLPALTQQLALPDAAQAAPGMADLMGDLSSRFGQLLSASPAGSNTSLSLSDFLKALAQSFMSATPSQPAAPATTASPPDTALATATSAPGSSTQADYGQVLSFSATVRSRWLLAA